MYMYAGHHWREQYLFVYRQVIIGDYSASLCTCMQVIIGENSTCWCTFRPSLERIVQVYVHVWGHHWREQYLVMYRQVVIRDRENSTSLCTCTHVIVREKRTSLLPLIVFVRCYFLLSSRFTWLLSHVTLNEWLSIARFEYPPQWWTTVLFGCYMADATWNCRRLGARSVYTIQPRTSLQCHFIRSHMHVRLSVTCHLHFWKNDRDLLRATVVTRGKEMIQK